MVAFTLRNHIVAAHQNGLLHCILVDFYSGVSPDIDPALRFRDNTSLTAADVGIFGSCCVPAYLVAGCVVCCLRLWRTRHLWLHLRTIFGDLAGGQCAWSACCDSRAG